MDVSFFEHGSDGFNGWLKREGLSEHGLNGLNGWFKRGGFIRNESEGLNGWLVADNALAFKTIRTAKVE